MEVMIEPYEDLTFEGEIPVPYEKHHFIIKKSKDINVTQLGLRHRMLEGKPPIERVKVPGRFRQAIA